MKRFLAWPALIVLVASAALPLRTIQAQATPVPITAANAAQVVELARFGRGMAEGATWSPDGSQLLVYGGAGVWLYDASDLTVQPTLIGGYSDNVRSAVFNTDGTLIVAGTDDGTVRVWDTVAGQETLLLDSEGNFGTARAAISPDGTRIVMSVDDNLLLRDAVTGDVLVELKDAHANTIVDLAFSPDGSWIVSASSDKTARLWDAFTLEEIAVMEGHTSYVNDVDISPDGTRIVTGGSDKTTRLWDAATGAEVAILEQEQGNVFCVDFSPDGTLVAAGSSYGELRLLDAATLTLQAVWEGTHETDVRSVAFSPDGTTLATVGYDQAVKLWDVASGAELASAPGHTRQVSNLALSPDGRLILAGSYDGTLRVWDITGDDAHPVFAAKEGVSSTTDNLHIADFSPDGTRFAGFYGSTLRVWETASGALLFEVGDYELGFFRSLSFSPDGSVIAVTNRNATVLLWDAQTGDLLNTLTGHTDSTTPVLFSADGSLLISGGGDGTVRVWGVPEMADMLGVAAGEGTAASVMPVPPWTYRVAAKKKK
jgi:WD40 repeat protein